MTIPARARTIASIAGLAVVCAAAALHAHPDPEPKPTGTEPAGAAPADKPESVLGGPKVTVRKARPTLVERDSEGKVKRLDERPEIAATALLELTGEPKKATEKVINEHAAVVARVLNENLGLFTQIQNARQSDDQKGGQALIRELRQKAPQLWEPALIDQLSKALPVEKAVTLRSLVNEYLAALAAEGGPDGKPHPRPAPGAAPRDGAMGGDSMMQEGTMSGGGGGASSPTPPPSILDDPQVARRIENGLVLREMARSLKTMTDMRREKTEQLLAGLDLSPDVDAKVRGMIRETGEKAKGGQPSREEHRALIEKIRLLLTPEQNQRLNENLKNR